MKVILVGCEFTGKTTLANEIVEWSETNLGSSSHFHDHFTIPSTELGDKAAEEYRLANPQIKEMFQRFMILYHISDDFYSNADHNLMGLHIEEAVYAPLYYGYGGENSGAPSRSPAGQRTEMARHTEKQILEKEVQLRHMMKLLSRAQLVDMLKVAGFSTIEQFWQNYNFVSFIAVKT